MLTGEIKRQINAARDILVGKIPDPKGQITQITNALIYKFMDDQDRLAQTLPGGKATFFTGELAPYTWHKLFDSKLSNQDKANLYIEGLEKLSKSKHLPELFQDIFKEAFLPFRAPDTIAMFLTTINTFDYNHSEDLGNAFEYLLSIMGSQGDAGQFRTPRNIIEFIVDAVNPQKEETILDPACGTAGFLVESYKHITESKKLSPREIQELADHIYGVDIDPGMAKIARVNLYLHGFKTPHITENDTLTNESLWGKKYDVILANPPFMTPKGGIKPHDKFIKATKAEVLFTDYIAEHLKLAGRAGIIVPEGIIERSGTVYKQLRKRLVDDKYLWAVISLPAGVFNPYSGVKTSILLLDRKRASENSEILFVKVTNDGFDLGAQRREVDGSDLPEALRIVEKWRINEKVESSIVLYIDKTKIADSDDYILSSSRYFTEVDYTNAKWPMVELGEICKVDWGNTNLTKSSYISEGKFLAVSATGGDGRIDHYEHEIGVTVLSAIGANCGKVFFPEEKFTAIKNTITFSPNREKIFPKYLFYILNKNGFPVRGMGQPFMSKGDVQKYKFPLPPVEIQEEIVAELDGYSGIIDGAKKITENWKPNIKMNTEWKKFKLKEISDKITKGTTPTTNGFKFQEEGINFIKIESIDDDGYFIRQKFAHINNECNESLKRSQLKENDVLFSIAGALGRVALVDSSVLPANTNQALAIISPKKELYPKYLEQVLRSGLIQNQISGLKVGVAQSNLSLTQVADFEIPLPSLDIQKKIVEEIDAERSLVESSRKLIEIYQQKSKEAIGKLWNE